MARTQRAVAGLVVQTALAVVALAAEEVDSDLEVALGGLEEAVESQRKVKKYLRLKSRKLYKVN